MNRCKEILKKAVSLNESFGKFIGDANKLTDKLVELGNKPVGQTVPLARQLYLDFQGNSFYAFIINLLYSSAFPLAIHF